jgi:hypothetical protein
VSNAATAGDEATMEASSGASVLSSLAIAENAGPESGIDPAARCKPGLVTCTKGCCAPPGACRQICGH